MSTRRFPRVLVSALASLAVPALASAQCADWTGEFGALPSFAPSFAAVEALIVHDDGSGPALYAGGTFTSAPGVATGRVARWDGSTWSALGAGIGDGAVRALTVYDDGGGAALYAAGSFTTAGGQAASRIARWDGAGWSPLGAGLDGEVHALAVYDSGSGPELVAGGLFANAGGSPASRVARWNGSTWTPLGAGMSDGGVFALATYDGGAGPELYAGGVFASAGGVAANHVARWDGASWSSLSTGVAGGEEIQVTVLPIVLALAVHDGGDGPALFLGGDFLTAGGLDARRVAKWDGAAFVPAPGIPIVAFEFQARVEALTVADVGNGPELFAGGVFFTFQGRSLVRLAGGGWASVGGGLPDPDQEVRALAAFEAQPGAGAELYAGGNFDEIGSVDAERIARFDGASWDFAVTGAASLGLDGPVNDLVSADLGDGPALYVAGSFAHAGTEPIPQLGRWTSAGWSTIGWPGSLVSCLAVFDDGQGPALYAGGPFTVAGGAPGDRIARWDGTSWTPVGGGLDGIVREMVVHDDGSGPALYVNGNFSTAGGVPASRIARWDGASWSPVGPAQQVAEGVLAVADLGGGPALYASLAPFATPALARWNGTSWDALGTASGALSGQISSLVAWDDGSGPALYVGGAFTTIGGVSASRIARFDGSSWTALGSGLSGSGSGVFQARQLAVHDDGSGAALYVAGFFQSAGGSPANHIARWDGSAWSALGSGVSGNVNALQVHDDGAGEGPELYVGGVFQSAGGQTALRLAVWGGCRIEAFCFGDGSIGACPCGNAGLAERGCDNSAGTGGATLAAHGTVTPDALVLDAAGELAGSLSIFSQGSLALGGPVPFGDGLRCVGGALKRMYNGNASGGAISRPGPGDPSITARSAALGDPIAPGSTRYYYVYYRDPDPLFCPSGGGFNVGNALSVVW